jgi:molecular chaperone GrpE
LTKDTAEQNENAQTMEANEPLESMADSIAEGDATEAQVVNETADPTVQELEETRQQVLRLSADFENFRRRTRQEKEDLQKFATKKLLVDLLPVVDNLERALTAVSGQQSDELLTGVDMVRRQLLGVLEQHGVTVMETVGQAFDPNLHEAVMQTPVEGQEAGLVAEEFQRGYWLAGRVLRPAMVKVTV